MNQSSPWTFKARMESLHPLLSLTELHCEQQGLAQNDVLRLSLIIEELFTNTVKHGHGGDSDAAVNITVSFSDTHVHLRYEDEAPPFDPLRYLAETSTHRQFPVEHRPVGCLGLPLIADMAESFNYAYANARNCLQLALRRETPA